MEKKLQKNISYILQFIDSTRLMASALSNLVIKLSEGIHRIECRFGHHNKKCETCGIKYNYRDCFLEYTNFKDDLTEHKCLCCSKNYQQEFDEKLKKRFLIHINLLTMITISLCYCCKKVFIHMNI